MPYACDNGHFHKDEHAATMCDDLARSVRTGLPMLKNTRTPGPWRAAETPKDGWFIVDAQGRNVLYGVPEGQGRDSAHQRATRQRVSSGQAMTEKHKAQVALREAAAEFATALHAPVKDAHDSAFAKVDAKLMKAAVRYADAAGGRHATV